MPENYFKYLKVNEVEERWGMYITALGYSKIESNQNYPIANHPPTHYLTWNRGRTLNDFYIVYISKGKGQYGSSLTPSTKVTEGTCFFLYPGIWHRYKPEIKSGWEEYWVGFNGSYAKHLMSEDFFDHNKTLLNIGLSKEVVKLFTKLIDVVKQGYVGYPQQLAGIAVQLLGHIHCFSQNLISNNNDPKQKLIDKARFLIQESFDNILDMEKLASQLPMGYSSFRKVFKELTGESPNQYHINLRLERAKQLLEITLLNISEIAFQTGFETVSYFSKLFKKKNGVSPKAYREAHDKRR